MAEVVLALDVPEWAQARDLLGRIEGVEWVKVGSILYLREGPRVVEELRELELRVFLDLKWHDIPHTVAETVRTAAAMGVEMATLHTLGGYAMLAAAAAVRGALNLVGVTVLTSHSEGSYSEALDWETPRDLSEEARRLARLAHDAGLQGVVCSPWEVARLRPEVGDGGLVVVPGIRPSGFAGDDQRRTADPRGAAVAGATHLVVGRPILNAPDPQAAFRQILEEAQAQ